MVIVIVHCVFLDLQLCSREADLRASSEGHHSLRVSYCLYMELMCTVFTVFSSFLRSSKMFVHSYYKFDCIFAFIFLWFFCNFNCYSGVCSTGLSHICSINDLTCGSFLRFTLKILCVRSYPPPPPHAHAHTHAHTHTCTHII